jgi:hypothetical protein
MAQINEEALALARAAHKAEGHGSLALTVMLAHLSDQLERLFGRTTEQVLATDAAEWEAVEQARVEREERLASAAQRIADALEKLARNDTARTCFTGPGDEPNSAQLNVGANCDVRHF